MARRKDGRPRSLPIDDARYPRVKQLVNDERMEEAQALKNQILSDITKEIN